jgi:hypothetical protein
MSSNLPVSSANLWHRGLVVIPEPDVPLFIILAYWTAPPPARKRKEIWGFTLAEPLSHRSHSSPKNTPVNVKMMFIRAAGFCGSLVLRMIACKMLLVFDHFIPNEEVCLCILNW